MPTSQKWNKPKAKQIMVKPNQLLPIKPPKMQTMYYLWKLSNIQVHWALVGWPSGVALEPHASYPNRVNTIAQVLCVKRLGCVRHVANPKAKSGGKLQNHWCQCQSGNIWRQKVNCLRCWEMRLKMFSNKSGYTLKFPFPNGEGGFEWTCSMFMAVWIR